MKYIGDVTINECQECEGSGEIMERDDYGDSSFFSNVIPCPACHPESERDTGLCRHGNCRDGAHQIPEEGKDEAVAEEVG